MFWSALALLLCAACATPASRIKRHRAAFDAYPPAIQQSIRAGKAEVGFTREQVELALGPPDRKYVRKTAAFTQDVWSYGVVPTRPRVGVGFGMSSGHRGGYGGGVGVGSPAPDEERTRVVFEDNAAVSIETLQR